jgi:hypothetical protein
MENRARRNPAGRLDQKKNPDRDGFSVPADPDNGRVSVGVGVTVRAVLVSPGMSTMRDLPLLVDFPVLVAAEAARTKQIFDAVATFPEMSLAFTRRVRDVAVVLGTVQLNVPVLPWFAVMAL